MFGASQDERHLKNIDLIKQHVARHSHRSLASYPLDVLSRWDPQSQAKFRTEFEKSASVAFEDYLATGKDPTSYTSLIVQAEILQASKKLGELTGSKVEVHQRYLDSLADLYIAFGRTLDRVQKQARKAPHDISSIKILRKLLNEEGLNQYQETSARLGDLFAHGGLNCRGQTLMILALIKDSGWPIPPGWEVAIQEYDTHWQVVLFERASGKILEILTGKVYKKIYGPLYHPIIAVGDVWESAGGAPLSIDERSPLIAPPNTWHKRPSFHPYEATVDPTSGAWFSGRNRNLGSWPGGAGFVMQRIAALLPASMLSKIYSFTDRVEPKVREGDTDPSTPSNKWLALAATILATSIGANSVMVFDIFNPDVIGNAYDRYFDPLAVAIQDEQKKVAIYYPVPSDRFSHPEWTTNDDVGFSVSDGRLYVDSPKLMRELLKHPSASERYSILNQRLEKISQRGFNLSRATPPGDVLSLIDGEHPRRRLDIVRIHDLFCSVVSPRRYRKLPRGWLERFKKALELIFGYI